MTMTNSTSEREQRLKQIRERAATFKTGTVYAEVYLQDVQFLLSLLDGEAATGDLSHCALCEDPSFIYRDCVLAAATRMRDLCVEKVKALCTRFQQAADSSRLPNDLTASRDAAAAAALARAVSELESLTLEREQKTK